MSRQIAANADYRLAAWAMRTVPPGEVYERAGNCRLRRVATAASVRRAMSMIAAHVARVGTGPPLQGVMLLVSSVTAPFLANALPVMFEPVFKVMLDSAIRLPMNDVPVPTVAELPICHMTPHGFPPLIRTTADPLAVVNELPVLKMNVEPALPSALSVRVPVN